VIWVAAEITPDHARGWGLPEGLITAPVAMRAAADLTDEIEVDGATRGEFHDALLSHAGAPLPLIRIRRSMRGAGAGAPPVAGHLDPPRRGRIASPSLGPVSRPTPIWSRILGR
jgi:hypothetical protein